MLFKGPRVISLRNCFGLNVPDKRCFFGTLASDNFDRTDNDTVGTGWVEVVGDWDIVSNKLGMVAHSAIPNVCRFDTALNEVPSGNYEVEAIVRMSVAGEIWVMGRYQDTNNFYLIQVNTSSSELRFYKRVAGSYTELQLPFASTYVINTDYTIKIKFTGTTIKGYENGVERFSVTDSSLSTGKPALGGYPASQSGGGLLFNNFAVYGDISSPSASVSPSSSVSLSPSASASPSSSISPSPSRSISLSPSASVSPSSSISPSPSVSVSLSPSATPSASPSLSPSVSVSLSPSLSPSRSLSLSPSLSASLSPSVSPSLSSSLSISLSPSPSMGVGAGAGSFKDDLIEFSFLEGVIN